MVAATGRWPTPLRTHCRQLPVSDARRVSAPADVAIASATAMPTRIRLPGLGLAMPRVHGKTDTEPKTAAISLSSGPSVRNGHGVTLTEWMIPGWTKRCYGAQARMAAIAVFFASGPDTRGLTIGSASPALR